MMGRPDLRLGAVESLDDEELARLEYATPGPWNDSNTEGFSLDKPTQGYDVVKQPSRRHVPAAPGDFLAVVPTGSNKNARELIRQAKLPSRYGNLDSASFTTAYNDLVSQTESMELTRATNTRRRQLHMEALQLGIDQLSPERVACEKEIIRFNALKNEVDIFQQFLDPFVFEIRTPREHSVHSSVYRHFIRMQGIQDMGIPIYSLGSYSDEPNDKIIMPRTLESFYRRVRRRNASDFIDASLVSRPTQRGKTGARKEKD